MSPSRPKPSTRFSAQDVLKQKMESLRNVIPDQKIPSHKSNDNSKSQGSVSISERNSNEEQTPISVRAAAPEFSNFCFSKNSNQELQLPKKERNTSLLDLESCL